MMLILQINIVPPFNKRLMTGTIFECTYNFLDVNDMLPVKWSTLLKLFSSIPLLSSIKPNISASCRKRHTILGMAWVDYKKAFIFLVFGKPWTCACVIEFVRTSMANWQTKLTSCRESLAKFNIRRWIF